MCPLQEYIIKTRAVFENKKNKIIKHSVIIINPFFIFLPILHLMLIIITGI